MSDKRHRELLKQNRLLVRQEGLAERDLAKVITALADDVAGRRVPGADEAALAIVDEHRNAIQAALAKRLLQTALLFGERTLARLEEIVPKSYYPAIPSGLGPVRGRDDPGLARKGFWEVFQSAIRNWVDLHALARAVTVTGTIKEAVRAILEDAAGEGWGEAETARAIQERIGGQLSRTNAARIARTEMHTAASIGADEAARSTGLQLIKEWAAAEDRRTRMSHAIADGQEVPLDEPFQVGLAKLMVPGDPAGPAREIINCRCTVLHHPVIGGEVIR